MPRPTSQDLAGFWDLLQLSIDDVTMKFDQLQQIKNNNWRLMDSPEKKVRGSRLCPTWDPCRALACNAESVLCNALKEARPFSHHATSCCLFLLCFCCLQKWEKREKKERVLKNIFDSDGPEIQVDYSCDTFCPLTSKKSFKKPKLSPRWMSFKNAKGEIKKKIVIIRINFE